MTAPPLVDCAELIARYDAFLLDAYGVLVHEAGPLPGAAEFIHALHRAKRPFCVLTNDAARCAEAHARRLEAMGIPVPAQCIVTSASLLRAHFRAHGLEGRACAVLGPADTVREAQAAGARVVLPDHDFEVLVLGDESGYPLLECLDAALSVIFQRVARGLPVQLLLPNPDLVYPAGDRFFGFTAGSLAGMVERALAQRHPKRPDLRFVPLGKPHGAIFAEGLRRTGTDAARAVMIGDTLETDVRGAIAAGVAAVLVTTGVSVPDWNEVPETDRPCALLRGLKVAPP
jgi:HAD superfamily hydrolase (TIGR01450 family)